MINLTNELVTQEHRYVRMPGFGRGRRSVYTLVWVMHVL